MPKPFKMCAVLFEVALRSSQGQLQTRLRFCSEFYFKTFITHKYVAYIALKRTFLIKSVYNYYTKRYQRPLSPPWKGIQGSLGVWIPRRGIRIPDTGFRILCKWQSFEGFWIPPAKSSQIKESGFPQNWRHFGWYCELFHSNSDGHVNSPCYF